MDYTFSNIWLRLEVLKFVKALAFRLMKPVNLGRVFFLNNTCTLIGSHNTCRQQTSNKIKIRPQIIVLFQMNVYQLE